MESFSGPGEELVLVVRDGGVDRHARDACRCYEAGEQIAAAVADHGRGHALCREGRRDDADVDQRLHADEDAHAERDQHALTGARLHADTQSDEHEDQVRHDHGQERDEAEFLAHDGQNEVGVILGEVHQLQTAFRESDSGPAARSERQQGVPELVAGGHPVRFCVHEHREAAPAHRVEFLDEQDRGRRQDQRERQDVPQAHPRYEQHQEIQRAEQDGRAQIFAREYEQDGRPDPDPAGNHDFPERFAFERARARCKELRHEERDDYFAKLGRLKREARELDPAPRAVDRLAEKRPHQKHVQHEDHDRTPVGETFAAEHDRARARDEADDHPYQLFREVRAALRDERGGIQHDEAEKRDHEREKNKDGELGQGRFFRRFDGLRVRLRLDGLTDFHVLSKYHA